ncbi:MAG TPA: hypothetical protein ENJ54_04310 [Chloroflexi bacterium]|nr:hypothetical protein [Chloroflexota bacterium]
MDAYQILVGVGSIYVAPANTPKPDLAAEPGSEWVYLGETEDGVTATKSQSIAEHKSDQRTGPIKATRTDESMTIATKLVAATLENLSVAIGGATVNDNPPQTGVIGTRNMGLYLGGEVKEFAILFRGSSPYGDYPGQFYVPRGYFGGEVGLEFKKDKETVIPVEFHALEDLNVADPTMRFGVVEYQDAPAQ